MSYQPKNKEEKSKELKSIIENIDKQIETVTQTPEDIKEFFRFMSNFREYSLNNTLLIQDQFRGATAVGSFAFWKSKGFSVKKGEKGISILVPVKPGVRFEAENGEIKLISKATKEEKALLAQNKLSILQPSVNLAFKKGSVFDIAQTNAKVSDLPKIFPGRWLEGTVSDYEMITKGLKEYANKIGVSLIPPKSELGAVKGVYYPLLHAIALNPRNEELQNVKTLIHELAHATLHQDITKDLSKAEKEFQAELTAVSVCEYLGVDTKEYSLPYLSGWTKGRKLKEKKELMREVHSASISMINAIEMERSLEMIKEKDVEKTKENNISQKKEHIKSSTRTKKRELSQTYEMELSY